LVSERNKTGIPIACFLMVWVGVAGFGCAPTPNGELSGKVTYKGEPVLLGTMSAVADDGTIASCRIDNGSYRLGGLSVGRIQVSIAGVTKQISAEEAEANKAKYLAERHSLKGDDSKENERPVDPNTVPIKYANSLTSGLTYDVKAGQQNHDFELQPP
jgi:hypothetical protein